MQLFKKMYLAGALTVLFMPFAAMAQTDTQPATIIPADKGILIADVNINALVATTTDGILSGSFLVKSSFGSQEGVVYGFVARSKTDGSILDTAKGKESLTLPEGESVSQNFSYTLPTYLSDAADIFLTLYTPTGVTLAVHKATEAAKGEGTATCMSNDNSLTCMSENDATFSISVFAGSPQGKTVAEKNISLSANEEGIVLFADLIQGLEPGRYVISGTVTEGGEVTGKVVREIAKGGPIAKIMSISAVNKETDGSNKVSATVYTVIARFATSSVYMLSMTSPGCGEVARVPVTKSVTELAFTTECENGQLTVNLLENGEIVDSATSTFVLPTTEKNTRYSFFGLAALGLAILSLTWFILNRHSIKRAVGTAVFLLAIASGFLVNPVPASAATEVISGSYFFQFCPGTCAGTTEEAGSINAQATITYPASVPANTQYTISLSQSATDATNHGICLDSASDTKDCHSIDVKTDVTLNGTSYSGTATHVSSVNYTPTAAASGNITFGATVNPYAPHYIGCDPVWLTPTTKCSMGVDSSENSMSATIPIVPAPTVNIYFSFLDTIKTRVGDMFAVLAAGK